MTVGEKFALVVVPAPLKEPLVYSIPKALEGYLKPGTRVLIPLQKRTVTGIVIEVVGASPVAKTKSIVAPLDEEPIFDHHLLKLARWIAQYYLASLGEVIATMLPAKSRRQSQKTITLEKTEMWNTEGFGRKVLDELQRQKGKMTVKTLAARFPGRSLDRILTRLEALGAIRVDDHLAGQRRKKSQLLAATDLLTINIPVRFELTTEQDNALRAIESRIKMSGFETFLLHGVTGSGKTEVYIRAMERAKELGRKSLILIPEISLTPQLLDRLHARFPQKVGVLHSALTEAERWAQWQEICHGKVDVVVGARSAVFAPIPGLGLIIVDEEHDSSYKQEDGLRYNGRDVAVVRGKFLNCPVILGSATPALESYENCRHGRYQLLEMTRRVEQRPLPTIEAIDLRRQFRVQARPANAKQSTATTHVNDTDSQLITEPFANALKENLQAGHQTLIFLNRRGFANFLQCTSCGYVWRCPYCSVTLTLHLRLQRISCHHCDYRRPTTDICPQCHHPTLTGIGSGTERIEQALKGLVPHARVARMDRDTTTKRGSHEQLIRRWERGEIDILVGTQMITKGHDVSGVTLVGALLADLSLNLPDFRAAERTFQLLSQVGGRSGRGDNPGRVIVQTYAPDHYAIQHLVRHDYKNFFAAESEFRQALNYPPFSRLVNLRIDGPKLSEVEKKSQELALRLRELKTRKPEVFAQIEVLGPAAAPIEKLRNRYRWQLLLRGKQSSALLEFARQARQLLPPGRAVRLHIDVDPYSML
jgi:primosomal protein N' (replication factor Y) (superfamily II helicase)